MTAARGDVPMWVLSAVFLTVGMGLLAGAGWNFRSIRAFAATAMRAEGVVIEMKHRGGSCAPVVRFQPPEGAEVTVVGTVYSRPPAYSVGEEVSVLFPSGRPEEAQLTGFWDLHLVTVVLGGIGGTFTLLGAAFAYVFVLRR